MPGLGASLIGMLSALVAQMQSSEGTAIVSAFTAHGLPPPDAGHDSGVRVYGARGGVCGSKRAAEIRKVTLGVA